MKFLFVVATIVAATACSSAQTWSTAPRTAAANQSDVVQVEVPDSIAAAPLQSSSETSVVVSARIRLQEGEKIVTEPVVTTTLGEAATVGSSMQGSGVWDRFKIVPTRIESELYALELTYTRNDGRPFRKILRVPAGQSAWRWNFAPGQAGSIRVVVDITGPSEA